MKKAASKKELIETVVKSFRSFRSGMSVEFEGMVYRISQESLDKDTGILYFRRGSSEMDALLCNWANRFAIKANGHLYLTGAAPFCLEDEDFPEDVHTVGEARKIMNERLDGELEETLAKSAPLDISHNSALIETARLKARRNVLTGEPVETAALHCDGFNTRNVEAVLLGFSGEGEVAKKLGDKYCSDLVDDYRKNRAVEEEAERLIRTHKAVTGEELRMYKAVSALTTKTLTMVFKTKDGEVPVIILKEALLHDIEVGGAVNPTRLDAKNRDKLKHAQECFFSGIKPTDASRLCSRGRDIYVRPTNWDEEDELPF